MFVMFINGLDNTVLTDSKKGGVSRFDYIFLMKVVKLPASCSFC